MDEALKALWQFVVPGLPGAGPGDSGTGIYKHWRDKATRFRLGSPIGPEFIDGGVPHQAFSSGIVVKWAPEGPVEV